MSEWRVNQRRGRQGRESDDRSGRASIDLRGLTTRPEEPAQPATPRQTLQQRTQTPHQQRFEKSSASSGLNLARRHASRRVSAMGRVDLPIVQQEEFLHEQELCQWLPNEQQKIGGCWRIGSSRQHPSTWANCVDWTNSTDADDGERTRR